MISLLVSSTGYVVAFVEFMRPDKFSRAAKYKQKEYDKFKREKYHFIYSLKLIKRNNFENDSVNSIKYKPSYSPEGTKSRYISFKKVCTHNRIITVVEIEGFCPNGTLLLGTLLPEGHVWASIEGERVL